MCISTNSANPLSRIQPVISSGSGSTTTFPRRAIVTQVACFWLIQEGWIVLVTSAWRHKIEWRVSRWRNKWSVLGVDIRLIWLIWLIWFDDEKKSKIEAPEFIILEKTSWLWLAHHLPLAATENWCLRIPRFGANWTDLSPPIFGYSPKPRDTKSEFQSTYLSDRSPTTDRFSMPGLLRRDYFRLHL